MKYQKRNRKGFRIFSIILCLILVVVFLNPFSLSHYYNNFTLRNFAKNLFELSLPPQTVDVLKRSYVGGLYGNGDNCDFQAIRELKTNLSREEIVKYFEDIELPAARGIGKVQIQIHLIEESEDGLYVQLELLDEANNPLLDLRCM